jgi:hypothetical protein
VTFVTERPRLRLDSPVTQQGGPSGILEKKIFLFLFFLVPRVSKIKSFLRNQRDREKEENSSAM